MLILGIDEVGRGAWAGPVVAGAVVLRSPIVGLKDSKLLTKNRREALSIQINKQALAVGIGWVEASIIDNIGINDAVELAMKRALEQIKCSFDQIIIDGNINYFSEDHRAIAMIRADQSVPEVSAASIIAKVARDRFMSRQAKLYLDYGFENNVGYGTAYHRIQLEKQGVCRLHRLSFKPIKNRLSTLQ